ncbi:MAG: hypothetical protein AAF726_13030 [Planctomycetota bacterium]
MTDPTDRRSPAHSLAKLGVLGVVALACTGLLLVELYRPRTSPDAATGSAPEETSHAELRPVKRVRVKVSGLPAGSRFGLLSRMSGEGLRLQVARLPDDLIAAVPKTGEILAGISREAFLARALAHDGAEADLLVRFADRGSVLLRAESGVLDAASVSLDLPAEAPLNRREIAGMRALWAAFQKGGVGSATIVGARRRNLDPELPIEILSSNPSSLGPLLASFASLRPQQLNGGDVAWSPLPPGAYRFTISPSALQTFGEPPASASFSRDRSRREVTVGLGRGKGVVIPVRDVTEATVRGSVAALRPFESCEVSLKWFAGVEERVLVDSDDFRFSRLDEGRYLVKVAARLGENHYAVAGEWVDVRGNGEFAVEFDGRRGRRLEVAFEPEFGDVSLTQELREPEWAVLLTDFDEGKGSHIPHSLSWRTADGPLVVDGLKARAHSVWCNALDLIGPDGRSVYEGQLSEILATEGDVEVTFAPRAIEWERRSSSPSRR